MTVLPTVVKTMTEKNIPDKLFTREEAAEYLGLTLSEFIDNDRLICYRLLFYNKFYTQNELDRFKREVLDL